MIVPFTNKYHTTISLTCSHFFSSSLLFSAFEFRKWKEKFENLFKLNSIKVIEYDYKFFDTFSQQTMEFPKTAPSLTQNTSIPFTYSSKHNLMAIEQILSTNYISLFKFHYYAHFSEFKSSNFDESFNIISFILYHSYLFLFVSQNLDHKFLSINSYIYKERTRYLALFWFNSNKNPKKEFFIFAQELELNKKYHNIFHFDNKLKIEEWKRDNFSYFKQ